MLSKMSPQMKKMLITLAIVFGIIFGWYAVKKVLFMWFMGHYQPPAVTVSAVTATETNWQSYLPSVGTLMAVNGVDISAEASGIVKEVRFQSGQFVNQGDVLVVLNTDVEDAQLKDNQAQAKLAEINYLRDKTLSQKNVLSQASFDATAAKLQEAQAGVEQVQALIKQKTITAPFSGKIGIRLIDIGQYVAAGTKMVTLQDLDPLYVRFNLPEQYMQDLYLQQPVDLTINLSGKKTVSGVITAIDSKVDQATRNILAQATISNKNMQLYPGMFADVKVWLREKKNVITLPQSSIAYSLHGDAVYLIKSEKKDRKGKPILQAYRQYVKVGERRDSDVVILDGIKAGDQVVTSGQLKLQNGTHVVIDNSVEL